MRSFLIIPILGIGLALPATAAPLSKSDARSAAQDLVAAWYQAAQQRDAVKLAALYSEDTVRIAPEGLLFGRATLQKAETEALKAYTADPPKVDNVATIGEGVMLVAGRWSGTYNAPAGPVHLAGFWSWATVRDGNSWKIREETFNNAPPPPAEPKK